MNHHLAAYVDLIQGLGFLVLLIISLIAVSMMYMNIKIISNMPKAFEQFKFTDDQKEGPVSEFWERVHLAAQALKKRTNCPNEIIASGLRAVAAEWD